MINITAPVGVTASGRRSAASVSAPPPPTSEGDGIGPSRADDRPSLASIHNQTAAWHGAEASGHGGPTVLNTTPDLAAAIHRGEHQIHVVDGVTIAQPSQDLRLIESARPFDHGQTHVGAKHIAPSLEDDVARLNREPHIPAAGGFVDESAAQYAVDHTIANPANQRFIGEFLADPTRYKDVLHRVDLGRTIGNDVLRSDLRAGDPQLRAAATATVVIIKDPSFPEQYRVLTAYPQARRGAEVDAGGNAL